MKSKVDCVWANSKCRIQIRMCLCESKSANWNLVCKIIMAKGNCMYTCEIKMSNWNVLLWNQIIKLACVCAKAKSQIQIVMWVLEIKKKQKKVFKVQCAHQLRMTRMAPLSESSSTMRLVGMQCYVDSSPLLPLLISCEIQSRKGCRWICWFRESRCFGCRR